MSQSDLKFIERALAHPWLFWVYFWKWPRIVRQACVEYDFLAKERDIAKAEHEKVARANQKLLNWVHVTHRLSNAPEGIRALFAAGKRLRIAILFLGLAISAEAQMPPLLRNHWTTNSAPRAITTLLTNGIRVVTNIWQLDLTNSATVTITAISNANGAVLSFAATNGGGSGGDQIWTNSDSFIYPLVTGLVSNGLGYAYGTGAAFVTNSIGGGYFSNSPDSNVRVSGGSLGGAMFLDSTNSNVTARNAGTAQGYFVESSHNSYAGALEGSWVGAVFENGSTNSRIVAYDAGFGGALFHGSPNSAVDLTTGVGSFQIYESQATVGAALGSMMGLVCFNSTNIFHNCERGSIGCAYIDHANNTSTEVNFGSFGMGVFLAPGEKIYAGKGNDDLAVSSLALGRNITSTNNWTFGIHGTNAVPISLALVVNGATAFRAASNGNLTIKGLDYVTPSAHAAGALTNDGLGNLGWGSAGNGGISSVYSNNVLAGSSLTQLGFTNTSTVTVVINSNANRATISLTAIGDGVGIATNAGVGWFTTLLNSTNTPTATTAVPLIVQGLASQTGDLQQWLSSAGTTNLAIASNGMIRGDMNWAADAVYDFGTTRRPRNGRFSGNLTVDGAGTFVGSLSFGSAQSFSANGRSQLVSPADGQWTMYNNAGAEFTRLNIGGTTAAFPALGKTAGEGHLRVLDGAGSSSTNSLIFAATIDTTARTGMTMNRQTGRVKIASGSQTYLLTNNLATTSSAVMATVNTDDATAVSCKAIPTAGLITLKLNGVAAADTEITFFISSP